MHASDDVGMQICNEGLKLMLKDSSTRELEEYKDKVSNVGANFSKEEDMQGATFAYVLYKMTEHIQVEEIHKLQVTSLLIKIAPGFQADASPVLLTLLIDIHDDSSSYLLPVHVIGSNAMLQGFTL